MRLEEQIDLKKTLRSGTAKAIKKRHHRAMRRLCNLTIEDEDVPSRLPFNKYHGWVS